MAQKFDSAPTTTSSDVVICENCEKPHHPRLECPRCGGSQ